MARSEAIDDLMWKINRNCAVKASCADFCDKNGHYGDKELWKRQPWRHSVRSFSWAQSNGNGRSLDLRWLEKVAGGEHRVNRIKANYQNWAGRTRCYRFPCTLNDWEVYYGVSVISNQGD